MTYLLASSAFSPTGNARRSEWTWVPGRHATCPRFSCRGYAKGEAGVLTSGIADWLYERSKACLREFWHDMVWRMVHHMVVELREGADSETRITRLALRSSQTTTLP